MGSHQEATAASSVPSQLVNGSCDYESMTVKELRELVKERSTRSQASDGEKLPHPPRGLMSNLKLKQDLVRYLLEDDAEIHSRRRSNGDGPVDLPLEENQRPTTSEQPVGVSARPKSALRMPPIDFMTDAARTGSTSTITATKNGRSQPSTSASPKELLIEQLYQRYPRLLLGEGETSRKGPGGDSMVIDGDSGKDAAEDDLQPQEDDDLVDVRVDHPMLRSINVSSSDMDLVFVGTASCTPGTTRGVSCTALRINGRRVSHPGGVVVRQPSSSKKARPADAQGAEQQQQPPQNYFQQQTFRGGTWLFDVGECTQLQIQRTPSIKPSKITKIFLSHAHGDHTFGLPGLLCLMGQDKDRAASVSASDSSSNGGDADDGPQGPRVVDIYGPQGLRMWLRVAIRYSVSRIVPPYRVHELMDIPMAPEWEYNGRTRRFYYSNNNNNNGQRSRSSSSAQSPPPNPTSSSSSSWQNPRQLVGQRDAVSWIAQAPTIKLDPSPMYGELEGGRDIYPVYDHPLSHDGAPVYEVEDEGGGEIKVFAAPMSHGIPCVGYVIEESAQPGRLRHEFVEPIVRRNVDALKKAGFAVPMKAMAVLKNLDPGTAFTFPDGTVVTFEEAVEPPRPGRKIVICGDTCDSRALSKLAEGADVVVHEATNTYLSGVDKRQEDSTGVNGLASFAQQMRTVTRDAIVHGHSTPFMAGNFAKAIGAHRLVLNHFSPRYKGDPSVDSMSIMLRIERQAMKGSGLNETHVAAAWDHMVLPLPRR